MEQPTDSRWERPDAPLGTLVYRAGLLSKEKLESALVEGRRTGKRLGEVLLQKGWIDEKDLARLVAGQKGVAFVSLRGRGFDAEVARRMEERIARGNDAVAVEDAGDHIVVAVADPTDEEAVAEVKNALGREIELVVATPSDIHEVLDEVFRPASDAPLTSDFALRLAEPVPVAPPVTEPVPEPDEPEPVLVVEPPVASEPVVVDVPAADDPAPVETPIAQPDFLAPVAIELPKLHPTPQPEEEPTPEVETRIEVVGLNPDPEPPASEPAAEGQNDAELGIAAPSEPVIERNEEAHVSLAFHTTPPEPEVVAEPEPEPEPEDARAEPEPSSRSPSPSRSPCSTSRLSPIPSRSSWSKPRPSPSPWSKQTPVVEEVPVPAVVADEIEMPPLTEDELGWRIVLNLVDDEELDVALFATEDEANAAAKELVAGMAKDAEWPQVGRKFIPPERITSVEVRERARYGGSTDRAQWGA